MRSENLNLKNILDLDKWQKLQDSLALVTRMAVITVDYKGNPVTEHSFCTSFCQQVRQDPELASYCRKCDARGGLEAVRQNKPYVYLCYFNIVDIAIPIIVDDKYIGAIMAGQVRLKNKKRENSLEQILSLPSDQRLKTKFKKLGKSYSSIPALHSDDVQNCAEMLFQLCNYIIEEALNKSLMFEIYENTLSGEVRPDLASTLATYKAENIETVKTEINNALVNTQIKELAFNINPGINPVLKPVFDYLIHHKSENMALKKAADLCHLSPGYFSRLFTKETGKNFSTYVSLLKIEWAKQLLETTNMTVLQISEELGFKESGYFIKIFKKYEGVTPISYRNYYKESFHSKN